MRKTFVITITVDVQPASDRPNGPCCLDELTRGESVGCNCPYTRGQSMCGSRHEASTVVAERCVTESQSRSER